MKDAARRIAAALDALDARRAFLTQSWRTWAQAHPGADPAAVFEAWAPDAAARLGEAATALAHCPPAALWRALVEAAEAGGLAPASAEGLRARIRAAFPDSL